MALTDEIPVGLAMLYSGYMQIEKYLSGTYSLTHLLTNSLTHSLTFLGKQIRVDLAYEFYRKYLQLLSAQIGSIHSLTHSLTHLLTYLLTH